MDSLGVQVPLTGDGSGALAKARRPRPDAAPAPGGRSTSLDALEVTLEALVPLRIHELRGTTFEQRSVLAREASAEIAAHGDVILYRGSRRDESGRAVGKLITGLACLAYQPGGVRIRLGNLAWCAAHLRHRWNPDDKVCARCLAEEPPDR